MSGRKGSWARSISISGYDERIGAEGGKTFQTAKKQSAKEYLDKFDLDIMYRRDSEREIKKFIQDVASNDGVRFNEESLSVRVTKEARERAENLIEELANRVTFTDKDAEHDYQVLASTFKNKKFYFSEDDRKDIVDFYKDYSDSPIKVTLDQSRTPLESIYLELQSGGLRTTSLKSTPVLSEQYKELYNAMRRLNNSRTYGIYDERARINSQVRSASDFKSEMVDDLLLTTGVLSYMYKGGRRGRRK